MSSLKEQLRAKGVAEREINACFEKRELVALLAKVNAEAASNETMTDALLPAGWARAVDPVTNGVYYQNASTGEKTWDVQAMRTKAEAMGRINIRVRPGVRFDETARGDTKEFRIHKETRLQKIFLPGDTDALWKLLWLCERDILQSTLPPYLPAPPQGSGIPSPHPPSLAWGEGGGGWWGGGARSWGHNAG